jgi:magnesium chelatase family protein
VGGSSPVRPGEITLAHRGVLFLDELSEFTRDSLEALRQPLEDGTITISRARSSVDLPCRFMLVAAANPCPCGRGDDSIDCDCSPSAVRRYRSRISGALADRIDIALTIEQPSAKALGGEPGECSATVRERVVAARERARRRQGECANGELGPAETRRHARLTGAARRALVSGHRAMGLTGRGHDRILRVARTVADLDGSERVEREHVEGAFALRRRTRS